MRKNSMKFHRRTSERGFALLLVILILTGMLIIGLPFAISMRLSSNRAKTELANAHARFAAEGAYNHAIACLMRTQEQYDPWPIARHTPEDTAYFEPHTLDIPAELEVTFEGTHDVLDLTDELEVRDPRGIIWSADVEDEQGKINLNSASRRLLENLLYLLNADPAAAEDERWDAAEAAADQLIEYRNAHTGFQTVAQAAAVLQAGDHFESGQLINFDSYVTVYSNRPNADAPHPININTAPELVLAANLMRLRLRVLEASPDTENQGNGSVSPVEISQDTPEGDWKIEFADSEISLSYKDDADYTAVQTITLDDETTWEGMTFTVFNGTIPFAIGDSFYFSTRRVTEELARDLAHAYQAEIKVTAKQNDALGSGPGATTFEVPSPSPLGDEGHVAIDHDVMTYMPFSGDYLFLSPDRDYETDTVYNARRIIARIHDLDFFTPVFEDDDLLDAEPPLTAAIKLNAVRPTSRYLEGGTAPFCFTTTDVYTITSRGSFNSESGGELASAGFRRIVSLSRPIPVQGEDQRHDGEWKIDTEAYFDALITTKSSNAFQAERSVDEPNILNTPRNFQYGDTYLEYPVVSFTPRKDWFVGTSPVFSTHFGSDLSVLSKSVGPLTPLRGLPYDIDADGDLKFQSTSTSATSESGVAFSSVSFNESRPRLAYATKPFDPNRNVLGLSKTCKSIQMWIQPEDWSDATRDYFLFDTSRPYLGVPVEAWAGGDSGAKANDLALSPFQNRIALFYDGENRELVFRIADAAISSPTVENSFRSAEIRYKFEPEPETWHHVKAIWSGLDYGEMTLLIDGKAPSGTDAGTGRYHPKITFNQVAGLASQPVGPVIVGNQVYDASNGYTQPTRGTAGTLDDPKPAPASGDPVTLYGYNVKFMQMHFPVSPRDPEDPENEFFDNLANYARNPSGQPARLEADLPETQPATAVRVVDENGQPIVIPADADSIPVDSVDGFSEKGFLLIGDEIVYYDSVSTSPASFDGCMRGVDIYNGGYDTNLSVGSTGVSTEPQEIADALEVKSISLYVTDNRPYPLPRYFKPADTDVENAAGFFGISSSPKNYVCIDNEFISYTHKPGQNFFVDLEMVTNHGFTMRGKQGTTVAEHMANQALAPVYRIHRDQPGGPDKNDAVTVIDDNISPGSSEAFINCVGTDRSYISFMGPIPTSCLLSENARLIRFPSDQLYRGTFFSLGTNSGPKAEYEDAANPYKMDKSAEAVIDEFKVSYGESRISIPRIVSEELPDSTPADYVLKILHPYFWDSEFNTHGLRGTGVQAWPTQGYALIGDEVVFYSTRYRHNVVEDETGAGAYCAPSSNVFLEDGLTQGATSLRWTPFDRGEDPETAGFCKDGGYLTLLSETRTEYGDVTRTMTDAARQYLIDIGLLTQEQVDDYGQQDPDTGEWTLTRDGGVYYGHVQEIISYTSMVEDGDGWRFEGLDRGLFGTQPVDHLPVQAEDPADGYRYPQVIANLAELQILQRGCLGTQPQRHPIGAQIMPLYHVISTIITDPLTTSQNELYVESHANFPQRGYLLVSDGTQQEVIGYTSKDYDADGKPYFGGVQFLRRRFCTPLVALDDIDTALQKRIVRLYEPRYDDLLPANPGSLDPDLANDSFDYFQYDTGDINLKGNLPYIEVSKRIRGAHWNAIKWVEGYANETTTPSWNDPALSRSSSGTELFVLARVNGKPDWSDEPIDWINYQAILQTIRNGTATPEEVADAENRIIRFKDPRQDNLINRDGDLLELRIYFKYNSDFADDQGEIKQWLSPLLRGLKVSYSAPSSVYQQEEVNY